MARQVRKESPTGYYHVMQRGVGKQILFEDSSDYERYINKLQECKNNLNFRLCAYCLMNNHVHMLIHVEEIETLSKLMQKIGNHYAFYYNLKYDHAGHVFQNRYRSEPIVDLSHFLACVRYIHNNPVKAFLGTRESYEWSSYKDYLRKKDDRSGTVDKFSARTLTDTTTIMEVLKTVEEFKAFSATADDRVFIDVEVNTATCATGQKIIRKHFGNDFENSLMVKQLRVEERNAIIREMKSAGMNNHQIELVTGVSRKLVGRIK